VTIGAQDLRIIAELAVVTFAFGLVVGFIGVGGAGVAVALLTGVFGLQAHTAIGTAIAAMLFVTLTGSVSHYREGNISHRLGLVIGLAGAAGAVLGADSSQGVPDEVLRIAAGLALWCLAILVFVRSRFASRAAVGNQATLDMEPTRSRREWAAGIGMGATGGAAAAFLGIGMAPLLQLGLLTIHRLPLRQTVGTAMMSLVFISAAGALAMARHGDVSGPHLIGLTIGLASGAFIGARFTRRAPRQVLRVAVVAVPITAGAMMLFL
jgi:uncharacterized protein